MFPRSFPKRLDGARLSPVAAALTLAFAGLSASANAATLSVGPGKTYSKPCQALKIAANGDIVEIDGSVTYSGDVCYITASNLTIRGVNGRPKIDAAGLNASGKGTWVVGGSNTVIENVEMYGAKVPDLNGAAIRLDGTHLTVRKSYLHDNENGILTNNDGVSNILIENTEFGHNGYGDGRSHNLYVGSVNSLIFRNNYSHDANVGHNLKSRAKTNTIAYNRFSSSGAGQPSYEIDLPNAGTSYVVGNVIQQPASNQNPNLLAYGAEGATNPGQDLYVVNNTFINDYSSGGNFILIGSTVTTPALIQNNVFAGTGTVTNQTLALQRTNYQSLLPAFVDRAGYDLRPAAGAPFINAGSTPGTSSAGIALTPTTEYVHVASGRNRVIAGQIDIGAYEAAATTTTTTAAATTSTTVATTTTTTAAPTTTTTATTSTTTKAPTTTTAATTTTTKAPTTTTAATTTTTVPATTTTTLAPTTTTTTAAATTTTRAATTTTTAAPTTTTLASADTIAPTVKFQSPANGSRVWGVVTVSASATDNKGLAQMYLLINGKQVAAQVSSSGTLSYRWDTRWQRGTFTLMAIAVDAAGNHNSTTINVYR